MDLKCIEDFKEIDNIDFYAIEDIENMTVISDSKRKTAFMAKDDVIFENFEDSKISQTDNCDQTYSFNDSKRIKLQENIKDEAIICNSLENYRNLTKNEIEVENQIDINKNRPDFSVIASNSELDSNQEHGEKISYYNNGDSSHTKNDTQMLQTEKRDEYLKNKHLRQLKRQKYVDFLSDNEDFVWSSSSWEASSAESSEFEVMKKKNTKKIRKNKLAERTKNICMTDCGESTVAKKKKRKNIRKETRKNKENGEEYTTKRGKIVPAKKMKPNSCSANNCNNKCYEINEERRKNLFLHFWVLDSMRRKDWLISHSKKQSIKRHRSSNKCSRKNTFKYFINEGEGQRQVCQQFLLCTLDIKQKNII